jgi:hypothetical protein
MEKQNKAFISYSRKDEVFAIKLAKELKSEGFPVWLDQLDVQPGARWIEDQNMLAECRIFIVILSPSSLASDHVLNEIEFAMDNGHTFLPVLWKDCTIPLQFRHVKYADFRERNFYDGVNDVMLLLREIMEDRTSTAQSIFNPEIEMEIGGSVVKKILKSAIEFTHRVNTKNTCMTFVSYSRADKDIVTKLVLALKADGFPIWMDTINIPPGVPWDNEIEKALTACEFVMVIMTPASVASENVKDEIGYAFRCDKRFIPIMLEKCDIPLRLHRLQYVDFTNRSYIEGLQDVEGLLNSLAG